MSTVLSHRYNCDMKFLFDLFPIILFFIAFKAWDIYAATAVAIAATMARTPAVVVFQDFICSP